MRIAFVLALAACGHSAGHRPDANSGDDAQDVQVDAAIDAPVCTGGAMWCTDSCIDVTTANDHCGDCTTTCDSGSTCSGGTCKPGHAATDPGTCTYVDQPGWLSCPEGMSCQCYYHYYKLFDHQAAHLDTWVSATEVDITGGMIPTNATVSGITPATIPIANPNSVYPYQLIVGPPLSIHIYATSGYIAPNFVKTTDADCGNEGKLLDCTFTAP
jgi:hypothetical protein